MMTPAATVQYPLPPLTLNEKTKLLDGLEAVRVSVPWALDHVNCWLLSAESDDISDATLIDTGINSRATREVWQGLFADKTPAQVIATHYHPDHCGLLGWFAERGANVCSQAQEIAVMQGIWATDEADYVQEFSHWYAQHGLTQEHIAPLAFVGHGYRKTVAALPDTDAWQTLEAGDSLNIGGRDFEVLVGHGHAPAMLMLFCADEQLLIAADQVLPKISPNISVLPGAPDKNPLASFLNSLEALKTLPVDTLVLPSHGEPFTGLHGRIDTLVQHHHERLNALRAVCKHPVQAADVLATLFQRKLDVQQMSFALGEAVAHLRYLVSLGELAEVEDGQAIRYTPL